jgi:hypothetical protein
MAKPGGKVMLKRDEQGWGWGQVGVYEEGWWAEDQIFTAEQCYL